MTANQIKCDSKGRIHISRSLREKYGEEFLVVAAPTELVLLPVPKDPIEDLARLGKPLQGKSLKSLGVQRPYWQGQLGRSRRNVSPLRIELSLEDRWAERRY